MESIARLGIATFVVLIWIAMIPGLARLALADGGKSGSAASSATATATLSPSASAASNAAASSNEQTNRAYGVGGTGLTSTAPCLSSVSVLFGIVATTYVEKGCIARTYAAQCKDNACRQQMACLDPDLLPEAKGALGCKP